MKKPDRTLTEMEGRIPKLNLDYVYIVYFQIHYYKLNVEYTFGPHVRSPVLQR
jgi:hypothetical protein